MVVMIIKDIVFTEREVDVIACICNGKSVKDSAQMLGISPYTVSSHVSNIIRKMNVSSTAEVGTSYYPRFTYHSYGQCTRTKITRDYAVLKFRFIETYPLRFVTGSASNVPHLLKINTFSGQGYNYNTYAFWCLESETFPITY